VTIRSSDVDGVDLVILPPVRDLGDGFTVRRALPSAHRRMVGPFIFFDQMGPATFASGEGLDVRPHPHIGLATVSYLIEGEMLHRDSVGSVQAIRPGEVNWMTAGSGIVHSERTGPEVRASGGPLFGLQTWVALPAAQEETAPSFAHHKAHEIPFIDDAGTRLTLIAGRSDGLVSPVKTFSDMLYADIQLGAGARYQLKAEHVERAIYVVSGEVEVIGQVGGFTTGELIIFKPGAEIVLTAKGAARLMLFGGEPFPEARLIYWNFVSSRADRIEQAKDDWRAQRFDRVPDEDEFIPLPADPKPVRYP
jgi:redox-sensitive bicupin YhaK (pirin superfamily)